VLIRAAQQQSSLAACEIYSYTPCTYMQRLTNIGLHGRVEAGEKRRRGGGDKPPDSLPQHNWQFIW